MANEPRSLVPLSILGAGALVGAGLYFGLAARPIVLSPPPTPEPPSASVAPALPPSNPAPVQATPPPEPPPATPGPLPPEVVTKATDDATRALERSKKQLVETCWKPAVAETPEPKTARFIFNLSFDAQGKESARGVTELRGESRADVGQCLRASTGGLEIPAPGAVVAVSISVVFP